MPVKAQSRHELIRQGQDSFKWGKNQEALAAFSGAYQLSETDLEIIESLNGMADSAYKLGGDDRVDAYSHIDESYVIASHLSLGEHENLTVVRAFVQTAQRAGSFLAARAIESELSSPMSPDGMYYETDDIVFGLRALSGALHDVEKAEQMAETEPDQYRINAQARIVAVFAIYGKIDVAKQLRDGLYRLARQSESKKLPTTNHELSRTQVTLARVAGVKRAHTARVVLRIMDKHGFDTKNASEARHHALELTQRIIP